MARSRKVATRRAFRDAKYGEGYDSFRTGLTFAEAIRQMSGPDHDPSTWPKCRNRRAVLGYMHEHKQRLWSQLMNEMERRAA